MPTQVLAFFRKETARGGKDRAKGKEESLKGARGLPNERTAYAAGRKRKMPGEKVPFQPAKHATFFDPTTIIRLVKQDRRVG